MTKSDGSQEIVVSAGYNVGGGTGDDGKTEILDLETLTWRPGPNFPTNSRANDGESLQYRDTFLAVGGYSWGKSEELAIWKYMPDEEEWTVVAMMENKRQKFAAIPLPFDTCNPQ